MAPEDGQAVDSIAKGATQSNATIANSTDSTNSSATIINARTKEGQVRENDFERRKVHYGWRFWTIFPALCVTALLASVETTVTSTALPFISHELNAGGLYVWFVNSYFLTSTCFQPLFGQMSNLFGRRWPTISAVTIFALGSGISGGSTSPGMLIAGRSIQGIGGGGINLMIEMIISDLVPLRERGKFLGIIFAVFSLGTSIGPFVGGIIVQRSSWRWVFYINLPISGVALVLLVLFLQVNYNKTTTFKEKVKRIDYVGNAILIAGIVSMLLALSWGGTIHAWSSYKVIVPLIMGFLGMVLFHVWEALPWCIEPTVPPHIFSNRTTSTALVLAFIHNMLTFWIIYFLPLYFQAVLGSSSTISGVQLLPTAVLSVPFGIATGIIITKTGRYRPIHFIAFALMTVGLGLFTLLDKNSSAAKWVIFQMIAAVGMGLLLTGILPAVQVDLAEKDVGAATASYAFMRSYGAIWGISIPAAIFNSQFSSLSYRITDADVRESLSGGAAYSSVTSTVVNSFPPLIKDEVVGVYTDSLKMVWQVAIAFAGLSFLLVFIEKEIKMRTTLETEYGIKETQKVKENEHVEDEK